MHSAEHFGDER